MKTLEHIGIAVADLEAAESIFGDILGIPAFKREEVAGESVLTAFFQSGESKVELLVPTSPDSAIASRAERASSIRPASRRHSTAAASQVAAS